MRHLRHGAFALLAAFAMGFPIARPAITALAAECSNVNDGAIVDKGWMDADGVRHISYSYSCSWNSSGTAKSIDAAIDRWNAQTGTTKVVFEWDGCSDEGGDIRFTENDLSQAAQPSPACAGYAWETDVVHIHPQATSNANANSTSYHDGLTWLLEHELGHTLGLDHRSGANVMNAPSYNACTSDVVDNVLPAQTSITSDDASQARTCSLNKSQNHFWNGGGETTRNPSETMEDCEDVYLIQVRWTCGGGWCSITWSNIQHLGTECNGTFYPAGG